MKKIFVKFIRVLLCLLVLVHLITWKPRTLVNQSRVDDVFMEMMRSRMTSRSEHVKRVCRELGLHDNMVSVRKNMIYSRKYKTLFCNIPKTGMTNWMKLFYILDKASNADDLPSKLEMKRAFRINDETMQSALRNDDVVKLIVVRDPFERLLSAFRDKLDTNPITYYKTLSTKIHERFKNNQFKGVAYANFSEFISYLVNSTSLVDGDLHWRNFRRLCQPCAVHYDVIVHQETIDEDSRYFLRLIGAPDDVTLDGAYKYHTDDVRTKRYYNSVGRTLVDRLYALLKDDYTLFNYSKPAILD